MVVGDKIKLVKPTGLLKDEGAIFEVTHINEHGFIFSDGETIGYSSYEYADYFEVITEEKKSVWTEWEYYDTLGINPTGDDLDPEDYILFNVYERCNGRKVQLETPFGNKMIRAEASCSPQDKFDEESGIRLATVRLTAKIYEALAGAIAGEM